MYRPLLASILFLFLFVVESQGKNMYIPVAGVTPGQNGTFFRTDVRIFNPSPTHEIDVTLHFLPKGIDGRYISGRMFHIGKRETLVLDNVVAALAPELTHVIGAIRIDSDTNASYEFIASSRTYTRGVLPGTYGQFIPAVDPAAARRTTAILHVSSTPELRTNLGVMNPGLEVARVKVTLIGIDGRAFLVSGEQLIQPKSMEQWPIQSLFGGLYMGDGVAIVESSEPVFTWGSSIDNATGDAIFVRGVEDSATVRPLAADGSDR